MTSKNRKRITCGRVTIRFVAKKWRDNIPTDLLKSLRGFFQVSTPEVTAFDLLLYPEYAGGLNNIATVLSELSEQLDVKKLVTCLEKIVKKKGKAIIPLVASGSRMGVKIDRKWNLFVNEKIEPDV